MITMILTNLTLLFFTIIFFYVSLKFIATTGLLHFIKKRWRFIQEKCYVYQYYKVPKFNENMQENQLYRKVHTYLNSLPHLEDSDFANLFSASKSSAEINLILNDNQTIYDNFIGVRICWRVEKSLTESINMKIRRTDKRRILVPYFQHIHQVCDEIEQKRKEVRLYVNVGNEPERNGRWRSTPFTHPATIDTVVMDPDLKLRIKSDLENFLKSGPYYHRLGRVWKRSYLLYGSSGTGKSTFIAAMAKLLSYDIYEINLHRVSNDSDLHFLLMQTTNRSILVVEDLDRYLAEKSTAVSASGILNFMDGIFSCCGEERVMVFTMNSKEGVDPDVLRPGRVDVHINFPLCDFTAFKSLAVSHLGLRDHKLFPQVDEIFQTGARLSPAEICEIMISNRGSPSRALKTVITALQGNLASRVGRRLNGCGSGRARDELSTRESSLFLKDEHSGIHPMKEIKNLYGFLRAKSSRKPSIDRLDVDLSNSSSIHGS